MHARVRSPHTFGLFVGLIADVMHIGTLCRFCKGGALVYLFTAFACGLEGEIESGAGKQN